MIMDVVCAFFAAFVFTNLIEWATHKYVLHGLGKKKDSFFHYHIHHHFIVRKHGFIDNDYKLGLLKSSAVRREIYGLVGLLILNSWLYFLWPMFYIFCIGFTILYWFCHSYSHKNVNWCKKYLPHHYDHHIFKENGNWCVTFIPLWDYIFKTRHKGIYDKNGKPTRNRKIL